MDLSGNESSSSGFREKAWLFNEPLDDMDKESIVTEGIGDKVTRKG